MKKILLAINGNSPRTEAIRYALNLASRVKAQLSVLQVLRPGEKPGGGIISAFRSGARALEESMVEATYAEAGEHELARRIKHELNLAVESLDESSADQRRRVEYDVSVATGEIKDEVTRFVKSHPEAVLAVYDGPDSVEQGDGPQALTPELPIPLVALEKRNVQKRGGAMKKPAIKKKSELSKAADKFERYQDAVAFAEGNMPEEAVRLLTEMDNERSVLLVMGRGHHFSDELKDYSVGLAGRLGYDILAVNNKNIPKDFIPLVSNYREKLRQDFSTLAEENASDFESRARKAGVNFIHRVKFGDTNEAIRELNQEFKKLDYVVSEPDEGVDVAPGGAPAIPVFCLNSF